MNTKRAVAIYILTGHCPLGVELNGHVARWNQYEDAGWLKWRDADYYLCQRPIIYWLTKLVYNTLAGWFKE